MGSDRQRSAESDQRSGEVAPNRLAAGTASAETTLTRVIAPTTGRGDGFVKVGDASVGELMRHGGTSQAG